MPCVSVIIPAYNSARYIGEALDSLVGQTYRDFEVVVVDDGSADDTLAVVNGYAQRLALRVIRQANGGPARARNEGVRAAAGQYCAFLDADDLMLPQRLEQQVAALRADGQIALVHTDLQTFNEGGVVHRTRRVFSDPRGGRVLDWLVLDNFITTSTVMARRDRLLEAGLFREGRHISEDFELWLRMAERWPIAYLETPLVMYRYTPGSLSGNKLVTALAALQVVREFWGEHPEYRRSHRALCRRSIARHLAVVGAAALDRGERGRAVRHLLGALRREPLNGRTFRWLVKALIRPMRRASGAGAGTGA